MLRRTRRCTIKLTEAEYRAMSAKAAASGLSLPAFFRSLARNAAPQTEAARTTAASGERAKAAKPEGSTR